MTIQLEPIFVEKQVHLMGTFANNDFIILAFTGKISLALNLKENTK
jgi:hypothetical protein